MERRKLKNCSTQSSYNVFTQHKFILCELNNKCKGHTNQFVVKLTMLQLTSCKILVSIKIDLLIMEFHGILMYFFFVYFSIQHSCLLVLN